MWKMTGLVTFIGPQIMVEIADYPTMPEYSERHMLEPLGTVEPSDW